MSKAFEITEMIERYLKNRLSEGEKKEFEKRMSENTELKESVELQVEVMKGLESLALKQKVSNAYKSYKLMKLLIKAGLVSLGVIAAILAVLIFKSVKHETHSSLPHKEELPNTKDIQPEENKVLPMQPSNKGVKEEKASEKDLEEAGQSLPTQLFILNAERDTVIQTRGELYLPSLHCASLMKMVSLQKEEFN